LTWMMFRILDPENTGNDTHKYDTRHGFVE